VSHYLLARALESSGCRARPQVVNTSDADMVGAFGHRRRHRGGHLEPAAGRDPPPRATKVFDSSQIPGEIIDLMVVNTETLETTRRFGKALTGAWYEIMAS
jgi:NitT/TauT family transport system substrate-binding protein